jgi:hypothetical protein
MHKEQGPDYITKYEGTDGKEVSQKLTLSQYSTKFRQGTSDLKMRAISQMRNMKDSEMGGGDESVQTGKDTNAENYTENL